TFYDDVKKLPAACFLKIRMQPDILIEVEKYWDIEVEKQQDDISDEDAIAKFNELFTTSIKRRLRSDVPLGTSLSGGLDSSSIATTIKELQGLNRESPLSDFELRTFSAIFPGFEKNEEKQIDEVAKHSSLRSFKTTINDNE